jgi:hypothetical protein
VKEGVIKMNQQFENNFKYHPATGDKGQRHEDIRNTLKNAAYFIEKHCPNSRERSLAITKLEEAMMWANAAIARNEE